MPEVDERSAALTHYHETAEERAAREHRIGRLLREGLVRDLSPREYGELVPPLNPTGCPQNWIRGKVVQLLNRRGYTVQGRRCS